MEVLRLQLEEAKLKNYETKLKNYADVINEAIVALQGLDTTTDDKGLEDNLGSVQVTLLASIATAPTDDVTAITDKLRKADLGFDRQESKDDQVTPASSRAFTVDDNVLDDFPHRPSFEKSFDFSSLGTTKHPVDVRDFNWLKAPTDPPPAWFTILFAVCEHLLVLRWLHNDGEAPGETKRVQPVLEVVLGVVGRKFGFLVCKANGVKLALTSTQGSVFPQHNYLGATDLLIKWDDRVVCLVEVKILFDHSKYFAQAVAEGYAAVSGLNSQSWNLSDAFSREEKAVPIVLLWNGPLAGRVVVETLSRCSAERCPCPADNVVWDVLRLLKKSKDRHAASSPFNWPSAPVKARGEGNEKPPPNPGQQGSGGKGGSNQGPSKQLSFSGALPTSQSNAQRVLQPVDTNARATATRVAKLSIDNLARFDLRFDGQDLW